MGPPAERIRRAPLLRGDLHRCARPGPWPLNRFSLQAGARGVGGSRTEDGGAGRLEERVGGVQAALRRATGGRDVLSIRASAVRPSEASIFSNSVEYLSGLCVAGFPNLTAPLHPS